MAKLRQVDVLTAQGQSIADAIRSIGVTEVTYYLYGRHCQTNVSGSAKGAGPRRSSRQLTPLGQGGSAVLFEDVAAVEVTVVVEVVVD